MSRRVQNFAEKRPLDLIEEAFALLRSAPASAYLAYYLGTAPFWLAFLYFVSDMSHGAFAGERLIGGSLALAVLFLWMKCWQSVFTSRLEGLVLLRPEDRWTASRIVRLISAQASIHPWGLLIRPIALLITLPFVWVSAFFQNVTVIGNGSEGAENRSVSIRAWHQATLWPGQAHLATVWVFIFSIFVFCNVLSAFFVAPAALKMFFDIETEASRHFGTIVNSTSLAAGFAITLMCVDPIFKALYVLRCFHGESIRSGLDLRVQLRRLKRGAAQAVVLLILFFGGIQHATASETPPANVSREELRESIHEVLQRREYAWRMPEKTDGLKATRSPRVKSFLEWVAEKVRELKKWFERLIERLFKPKKSDGSSGFGGLPLHETAYVLVAVAVGLIAFGIWRRMRENRRAALQAQPVVATPDLNSEDVTADQLPEDGWLDLMQRALAEGQNRAAVRAAYLASLAHLGQRELLTLARHKSNRDYDRELGRRARSRAELVGAFRDNLQAFERVWYGEHEVTDPAFEQFRRNLDVIRSC